MEKRIVWLSFLCACVVALFTGCGVRRTTPASLPHSLTPSLPYSLTADPWLLTDTSPDGAYRPTYLGNGYLGQVMDAAGLGVMGGAASAAEPAAGPGTGLRPAHGAQPASMAGLYDRGHLVVLPPLFPLHLEKNGQSYGSSLAASTGYSQTLDMRRGLLTTRATWNGQPLEITAFVSRSDSTLAVCRVMAPSGVRTPVEAGRPPTRVLWGSRVLTYPDPARTRTTVTVLETSVSQKAGLPSPAFAPASTANPPAVAHGEFDRLLSRHTAAWKQLWASDIEIEGSRADQQLVHALMYQLLASVRAGVNPAPGFPPMGLSNPAAFGGHVFWDADTWIYPALLPLHPELARTILEYRFRTLPGAKANAAAEGKKGASYAWESADTGREVATLDTRHGRHVTADVARAFWQYYLATGDRTWLRQQAWPVLSATAGYWVSRAVAPTFQSAKARGESAGLDSEASPTEGSALQSATPTGKSALQSSSWNAAQRWEIRRVSTPDENAGLVDNSAWTNFSARENLRAAAQAARLLGFSADPRWTQVADGLLIPRDASGMILEYSGYQGRPAKQADTLLLLFPGDMPLPRAEQERLFKYYVDRTIRNGPAMTESVHAVIAARLGQPEEAYRRFRESVDPFVRPPFLSFSEKRTRDNLQFLTGAAGSLQAVLYGFAGLRLEDSPTPVFHPQLPAAWSSLTLRNLSWRGKRYDVMIRRGQAARLTAR